MDKENYTEPLLERHDALRGLTAQAGSVKQKDVEKDNMDEKDNLTDKDFDESSNDD